MINIKKTIATVAATGMLVATMAVPAFAATTTVVTPANTQGWYEADVRPGGQVKYVTDTTSPLPTGALQLLTDSTNTAKAQYLKNVDVPLANVTDLSYYTKQVIGPAVADPSYQIVVDLNGDGTGFTTLVYEPYWNGIVSPGVWQQWDVDSGQFWSSKTVAPYVVSGAGGPPFYTLTQLKTLYPHAVVSAFGVNVGSYNPDYTVETDGVTFNDTTYNFEVANVPTGKDQCKNDGYKDLTDANGQSFKNQGQCVSYFNHL